MADPAELPREDSVKPSPARAEYFWDCDRAGYSKDFLAAQCADACQQWTPPRSRREFAPEKHPAAKRRRPARASGSIQASWIEPETCVRQSPVQGPVRADQDKPWLPVRPAFGAPS